MASRRVEAADWRATLQTERGEGGPSAALDDSAASSDAAASAASDEHKSMLRAAGRSAIDEALLAPAAGVKRKAADWSAEQLTADWFAYRDVYGSNGLAAGGATSSATAAARAEPGPDPEELVRASSSTTSSRPPIGWWAP